MNILNDANYAEQSNKTNVTVIYSHSPFCHTCKRGFDVVSKLEEKWNEVNFCTLDTIENNELAQQQLDVVQVPNVSFVVNNEVKTSITGMVSYTMINEVLKALHHDDVNYDKAVDTILKPLG